MVEGISQKNVAKERAKLVTKWNKSGLLRGLDSHKRSTMAQLLENEAAHILKESLSLTTGGGSMTSSGQIQGYTAIAFPIVRRVFGGLVANEIVSIQAMNLPSGLVFYIDYTYGSNVGGDAGVGLSNTATYGTYTRGQSIYNNPVGKAVQSGSLATGGMYDLAGSGYSRLHSASLTVSSSNLDFGAWTGASAAWTAAGTVASSTDFSGSNARHVQYDPKVEQDLADGTLDYMFVHVPTSAFTSAIPYGDLTKADQIGIYGFGTNNNSTAWGENYQGGTGVYNLRRLTRRGNWSNTTGIFTPNNLAGTHFQFVIRLTNGGTGPLNNTAAMTASMAMADQLSVDSSTGTTLTLPSFETNFGATPSPAIPEIDFKIDALAITTITRKLRARWSPEMAQDLNAYQAMDAEVELTGLLSEQIALEIDREILQEILAEANGANFYWSRAVGKIVNKTTGVAETLASSLSPGPSFYGTSHEWYETLIATIIDVANTIHRKTLRGSANFIITSPSVSTIIESSNFYKANISLDGDGQVASPFKIGCDKVGTLSNRFTVYVDPYFPENRVLVGYKGGSYLETGYVYAPYVPLIITPTLYQPDDFSPRKGVMTRYGKKMIRSDFYGTVTIIDMNIV